MAVIAPLVKTTPAKLRTEIVQWLARESSVDLSVRAAATLQLSPGQIKAYKSFSHWRSQIVSSPTALAVLLRINNDVVLRYEQGRDSRGMTDRLAGALMNVLGLSSEYVAQLRELPTGTE